MPIHDWTRIAAGMFHHFHHEWITEITRALNRGVLPAGYYAMAEQVAAGVEPDVVTLQGGGDDNGQASPSSETGGAGGTAVQTLPQVQLTAEVDRRLIPRKSSTVVVRHVSNDRIIAVVEVVSQANKASRSGLQAFIVKAADLLNDKIHLLILDLYPPGNRDPQGMHGELWNHLTEEEYKLAPDRPLTLAAYESGDKIRAYVVHRRVGETLPDLPLYLRPGQYVNVPLEATYQRAFAEFPQRWRSVLEAPG